MCGLSHPLVEVICVLPILHHRPGVLFIAVDNVGDVGAGPGARHVHHLATEHVWLGCDRFWGIGVLSFINWVVDWSEK